MLCSWWQGGEGLICGWDPPFPQRPVRQVLQLSVSDFIIQSKEQGEQLPVLWVVCRPLIQPHYVRQEFINSAQSLPASEKQHSCLALVPEVCTFPQSPGSCGSLSSRQPESVPCLLPVAAPLGPRTGIQLWSFFCCQPCWLHQSMPYPLAKSLLCSCFPLGRCTLKNPPKVIRVLTARNQHLMVIWKDSLLQTRHLFPLFLDQHHNLYTSHVAVLMLSPRATVRTPWEKNLMWMNLSVLPCLTLHSCRPPWSVFTWLLDQWRIQMSVIWLPFLLFAERWKQSTPSPVPGRCALPAHREPFRWGEIISWCDFMTQ